MKQSEAESLWEVNNLGLCLSLEPLGEVDEVHEVLQTAPTRLRGLMGGTWQRVRGIFRRSSSSSDTAEADAEEEEEAKSQESFLPADFRMLPPSSWEALHARFRSTTDDESEDGANNRASFHPGDFRMLPPSAWEALHARFQPETAATAETSGFASVLLAPLSDGPQKMDSEPLDARLNYANCRSARHE